MPLIQHLGTAFATGPGGIDDVPGQENNGDGVTVAEGANRPGNGWHANTSMTNYKSSQWNLYSTSNDWLDATIRTSGFCLHSGHQGSSNYPCDLAFQINSSTPQILNTFQWCKHSNACGNVDIYGSNKTINNGNFENNANWTWLGRGYMGGPGSEQDGYWHQINFNPYQLGFKWYKASVMDTSSGVGRVPYGTSSSQWQGYAMYGTRWVYGDCRFNDEGKEYVDGYRYWRYTIGSAGQSHHPRVSRIDIYDMDGTIHRLKTFTGDNTSDQGEYSFAPQTLDLGAGNKRRMVMASIYSTFTGSVRSADYSITASNDNSTWISMFAGLMRSYNQSGSGGSRGGIKYGTFSGADTWTG